MKRLNETYRVKRSATSDEFRADVTTWLERDDELLVLLRLSRAAGRKDWFLIRKPDDLSTILARSRPSDCLTVFSGNHLQHRGAADEQVLSRVLAVVGAHEECVVGAIAPGDPQVADAFEAVPGDEAWVTEWIRDHWGKQVAFGPYPPFLSDDPEDAIDGVVPDENGSVTVGIY